MKTSRNRQTEGTRTEEENIMEGSEEREKKQRMRKDLKNRHIRGKISNAMRETFFQQGVLKSRFRKPFH